MVLRDLLRAHALSKEKAGARPGWKKKGAEPGYWTVLDHAEVGAIDPVRVADFEAAKTEVIGEIENAMFTSAGDQGPVQAVERDYPFSMRSRISAWLMESSPSRSRVSPSA